MERITLENKVDNTRLYPPKNTCTNQGKIIFSHKLQGEKGRRKTAALNRDSVENKKKEFLEYHHKP
ncbi:hypothetical protein [Sulfurisphaera tokodaii]|uniref:Uncharacterized protein n=1 Tax=Sulfurisphaera tokodaii TaxID=111955 RepID=A0A832WE00_9CREN|nr:hypothetical protein [Sulfurisphaera tokodaii]HII73503.1 hypothetical protein [Sulfurisphaera tokodaii]